jgi:pimeloyl-ACP methyl ester carboxylesterase
MQWLLICRSAGQRVIAVDQRGHGLSDKPEDGYDFDTVVGDLRMLLDALEIDQAIVIGQSWGGNVTLAFGAAHPERVHGLGFVDGGYIDLQMRPENTWETVERRSQATLSSRHARGRSGQAYEKCTSGLDAGGHRRNDG